MLDYNDLLIAIKKASVDAVNASKPTEVAFGMVTSIEPLQINIEQKITLGMAQLTLTRNVTDFTTNVSVAWTSENVNHSHSYTDDGATMTTEENTHNHPVMGTKSITIHNALVVGDMVLLIRMQGGQKFIVMDRLG